LSLFEPHARTEWRFRWWPLLACILSGLETAYDDPARFQAFCHSLPPAKQQQLAALLPGLWQLEPTSPRALSSPTFHDPFIQTLVPTWRWQDPLADGSFTTQNGLTIRAANGRDLWNLNRSAPRLLRPVSGDFTIQTMCGPLLNAHNPLPSIGGLLIWRDDNHFLRLVWGNRGPDHISFEGCLDGQDIILGQGRLPHPNPTDGTPLTRVVLRLERQHNQVAALCSAGAAWFRVGQAAFPVGPVEAGLHAVGWIDRTIYPGAYPEGAGMRFERFELWDEATTPANHAKIRAAEAMK
jgi:hypothetical protein